MSAERVYILAGTYQQADIAARDDEWEPGSGRLGWGIAAAIRARCNHA